ncbi:MAG: hypothetical protein EXR95_07075 [Gemmatimonadetes bacterium]|nr:hypothetical protein [Gemmatimonadota bacterium]
MIPARGVHRAPQPVTLHDRAMDNLRFIRETMERSASFTAVSGWAGVAIGVVATGAAWLARGRSEPTWMAIWMGTAAISFAIAVVGMVIKSHAAGMPLVSGPGRKFASSFSPPILVGGLLTVALYLSGQTALLPGTWLLLYGTAVTTGGAHSVRIIPLTGSAFIVLGAAALFAPAAWGDAFMAAGFGGLHVLFGFLIVRRHGG